MNFEQSPEFKKDLKRLSKKWRSLPSDVADAELLITDVYTDSDELELVLQKFFNGKRATKLVIREDVEVVKMRLDVAALGRDDKARVVFVAIKTKSTIIFIELYSKNDKDREDKKRIKKYLQ